MAGNSANILAGIGSTTSIGSIAYFAAADTAKPPAVAFTADVQTLTLTGVTGGTFTLTGGLNATATTAPIPASASLPLASALQTAVQALPGFVGALVTGAAGGPYTITFPATLGLVPVLVANGTALTGTSPTAVVVHTTPGAGATMATAAIPGTFTDAGYITTAGLVANVAETTNNVKGYGSTATLRVIISDSSRSFDLDFLETNAVSQAVYNRQAIGSVVPSSLGAFDISVGGPVTQTYAAIFDLVDGYNHLRLYTPRLQVSTIKAYTVAPGKEISWPVTMTALPDVNGLAVYESFVINALVH